MQIVLLLWYHENDDNVFTNDWAVFWHQVIKSGYNDPSKSKCWKLFWATLILLLCTLARDIVETIARKIFGRSHSERRLGLMTSDD